MGIIIDYGTENYAVSPQRDKLKSLLEKKLEELYPKATQAEFDPNLRIEDLASAIEKGKLDQIKFTIKTPLRDDGNSFGPFDKRDYVMGKKEIEEIKKKMFPEKEQELPAGVKKIQYDPNVEAGSGHGLQGANFSMRKGELGV